MNGDAFEPDQPVRFRLVVVEACGVVACVGEDVSRFPCRFVAEGVVPDVDDAVAFSGWPNFEPPRSVGPIGLIWNMDVSAAGVPLPTMERTHHTVVLDAS